MTRQIHDHFIFGGADHEVVSGDGLVPFDPGSLGFSCTETVTSCRRGYVCTFGLNEDQLILDHLLTNHCEYDGRSKSYRSLELPEGWGPPLRRDPGNSDFDHAYSDLNLPLLYTGSLLLGSDILPALDEYSRWFQPAWTYRHVLELRFNEGTLAFAQDASESVRSLRAIRDMDAYGPALEGWVRDNEPIAHHLRGDLELWLDAWHRRPTHLVSVRCTKDLPGGIAAYKLHVDGEIQDTPKNLRSKANRDRWLLLLKEGRHRVFVREVGANRAISNIVEIALPLQGQAAFVLSASPSGLNLAPDTTSA